MNNKRITLALLALWLAIASCNLPNGQAVETQASLSPEDILKTATALVAGLPTVESTATSTTTLTLPSETSAPTATACTPTVVANTAVNIRSGPGTVYNVVGDLPQGGSATVAGKNQDGTWWYIEYPPGTSGHAWVSGSVVTASCIPSDIIVVAAPPTPPPASGTCKPGYVYRLARPSDKVCVLPASQAQAAADNAAAESRKIINVYGADACISGYVWREAYPGDKVCVTPATRSQAAADNAAAASRWVSGAYGPHTCISGYVWREATAGDDVCVTPEVRAQTAADNAAADSRKAINVYGPDACIAGYVWREAFPGDKVCVTPAVRAQTAAENADAPNHTWP